ncbi:MAG: filamentous hemagglutinin N-terminal domain-containing protein [Cyanobacteria bacterium P01_F01_bin.150]
MPFAVGLSLGINGWNSLIGAQIIPDTTLGPESSVVESSIINGIDVDQIEGGAIRRNFLFHSFEEFRIDEGQGAYFAQPDGIESILSRVTGANPSAIMGRLGVLGNADLFLLNPNGIVFGPNASLDIAGSFMATTVDGFEFADGTIFSAVNSEAAPLLTVNVTLGLQWGQDTGTIRVLSGQPNAAQAPLSVGQDLTLVAEDVRIERGLEAGGNMIVRSDAPIQLDGRFTTGGSLRFEQLDGRLGSVISDNGAVFQTARNFAVKDYTGVSLQVLAGGRVRIPGEIEINSASRAFNNSRVELSDGSAISLMGTTTPTVDIRAGLRLRSDTARSANARGDRDVIEVEPSGAATNTDIIIGTIRNPAGTIFLTNQFNSNPNLSGDINLDTVSTADFSGGGDITIDARGGITVRNIDASGGDRNAAINDFVSPTANARFINGNGGDINLFASGDIFMPHQSFLDSAGVRGGRIRLASDTAIIQEQAPDNLNLELPFWHQLSRISSSTLGLQKGKNILLSAPIINLGGNVYTSSYGSGDSGDLIITGENLSISQGLIVTLATEKGNAGTVDVDVEETISLGILDGLPPSLGSLSVSQNGGNAGDVTVEASSIEAINGGGIASVTIDFFDTGNVQGNTGDVTIITEHIHLSGFNPTPLPGTGTRTSSIVSQAELEAKGQGGNIIIATQSLNLSNGASVTTTLLGDGTAGDITINATEHITIDGAIFAEPIVEFSQPSSIDSQISLEATATGDGDGGTIIINTPRLELTNGGSITSESNGDGSAGSIDITVTDSIIVDGATLFAPDDTQFSRIAVVSGTDATGDAGEIQITSPMISVSNGGRITAASESLGEGGKIEIEGGRLLLDRNGRISAETVSNNGGDIILRFDDFISIRGSSQITATAGTGVGAGAGGDGGNITIDSDFIIAEPEGNNDITANAFEGRGGRVDITATGIFGLTPRSRDELESLFGTTASAQRGQFDPDNLPSSDITAISQANPTLDGVVAIESPDVEPIQPEMSAAIVEAPSINAICNAVTQGGSSFTVIGRGGISSAPTDPLNSASLWEDWYIAEPLVTASNAESNSLNQANVNQAYIGRHKTESHVMGPGRMAQAITSASLTEASLSEAQAWLTTDDGTVQLVLASTSTTLTSALSQQTDCRIFPTR